MAFAPLREHELGAARLTTTSMRLVRVSTDDLPEQRRLEILREVYGTWFNRVFRRRYGATPSDIRETALRRRR
jgi:hypothetical protein